MFGIGIGELILIAILVLIIMPKDIPKIIKKIAQLSAYIDRIKEELSKKE
jgi:Sec-independent protein translocase protein TatA